MCVHVCARVYVCVCVHVYVCVWVVAAGYYYHFKTVCKLLMNAESRSTQIALQYREAIKFGWRFYCCTPQLPPFVGQNTGTASRNAGGSPKTRSQLKGSTISGIFGLFIIILLLLLSFFITP